MAIFLFVAVCVGAKAQFSEQLSFPNWYISLYSGFNAFIGEGDIPGTKDNHFSAGNNVNVISTFGGGYDINTLLSARGQIGWAKFKWQTNDSIGGYAAALTLTADLMLNITRLVADYDPNRNFEFQVFLGTGAVYRSGLGYASNSSGKLLSPIGRAGVQANFYVSRRFVINLDLATNFVSDKMDGVVTRHFNDNYTSLMLGFTYHIIGCNCRFKPHNQVY